MTDVETAPLTGDGQEGKYKSANAPSPSLATKVPNKFHQLKVQMLLYQL